MRTILGSLLLVGGLLGAGALIGYFADSSVVTALVLVWEPFWMIGLVYAGLWLVLHRRWAYGAAALVGASAIPLLLRLPLPAAGFPTDPTEPALQALQRCTAAAPAPTDQVRLLQWTVDRQVSPDEMAALLEELRPDVAVLQNAGGGEAMEHVREDLGGDFLMQAGEGPGRGSVVYTRGVFNLCGEQTTWVEGEKTSYTTQLTFVGLSPSTIFPLVTGRVPDLWHPEWSALRGAAIHAQDRLLSGAQGPSTLVALDVAGPKTWRWLEGRMASWGLLATPAVPNWPLRVAGLPFPTIHAFDRAWAGSNWRVIGVERVPGTSGARGPVLTTFAPN